MPRRPARSTCASRPKKSWPGRLVRRRLTFAAETGDRVPAYLLIPRRPTGKRPAMLCLHQTVAIGKGEPAGLGGHENLRYALELAERGYVTLAPDYPNFGDYRVDVYRLGYASATMKGIWNHRRAVDLLSALPEVDRRRIGVIGHSLGGHNALFAAAFDSRIQAVVTSCGFNSFFKYCGGDLTGWSHAGYMPRIATAYGKDPKQMPFDFTEVLAALAPRPVFIHAPLGDANFEVSGVKDCVAGGGAGVCAARPAGKPGGSPPGGRPRFPARRSGRRLTNGWTGFWRLCVRENGSALGIKHAVTHSFAWATIPIKS